MKLRVVWCVRGFANLFVNSQECFFKVSATGRRNSGLK